MKTTFKFYFLLIIGTALLSSVVYGLAGSLVEKYSTVCSLFLMMMTVTSLAGMMKTIAMIPSARR
ncbi:MAG TPA: hypothetical protein VK589_17595 [Chryseolinea sp.]|nr:hypothetical protein [Chryseolinea sp.]